MDNPEVLNYVRIAYVASQAIILGVYFYISLQVTGSYRLVHYIIRLTLQTGQEEE